MTSDAQHADHTGKRGQEEEVAHLRKTLREQEARYRRDNRTLRLLSSVNQALLRAATEEELIHTVCMLAVEEGDYLLAWVGWAEDDAEKTVRPACVVGINDGYLETANISWADTPLGRGPTGMAIRNGRPAMVEDITIAPEYSPWREAALSRGFRASIALPINVNDKTIGTFNLYRGHPNAFPPEEVNLLTEMADDLAYGLASLRARIQREQAEVALKASAQRFRALIDAAPFGAHEYELRQDRNLIFVGFNPAADRILGVDHARYLGQTIEEAFPPLANTPIPDHYRDVARTGHRYDDEQVTYTYGEISGAYEISAFQTAQNRMAVFFRDITERRRAEEALRRARDLVSRIMETSPVGIIAANREGRITFANANAEQVLGLSRNEAIQRTYNAPDWRITDFAGNPFSDDQLPFTRVKATHQPIFDIRHAIERSDGQRVLLSINAAPVYTEEGTFDGMVASIEDITERVQAEDALRQNEARIRSIFRAAPIGIGMMINRTFREVNDRILSMTGYTRGELIGRNARILYPTQEEYDRVGREKYDEMQRSGSGTIETLWMRKDGMVIDILLSSTPIDQNDFMAGVTFTALDITERKRAEEALERERALLSTAIEILPFPIIFRSPEQTTLMLNHATTDFFHGERFELSGILQSLHLLSSHTHAPIPYEEWPESRALRGEIVPSTEYRLILPDGHEIPILAQAGPIYVHQQLIAAIIAFQDITDLKAADQAKDQFLMVLSHELKTPLTSIIGWAQTALSAPEFTQRALPIIEQAAWDQKRILDDLLDVSRIIHGKFTITRRPVDLWELMLETLQELRPHLQDRHLTLRISSPTEPLPVLADAGRIRQVFRNLLENAIKFTPPQGTISISGSRKDDWASIMVQDTGRGIATEDLPLLFQPFRQIERKEETGGLGLGLALCRGIVTAHDGNILAESPGQGKGSTFTVYLPLRQSSPNDDQQLTP